MPFVVVVLVLLLSLDSFAVAADLGMAGLSPGERLRLCLICAAFGPVMPLVGLAAGRVQPGWSRLGTGSEGRLRGGADAIAGLVLIGLAAWLFRASGSPGTVSGRSDPRPEREKPGTSGEGVEARTS